LDAAKIDEINFAAPNQIGLLERRGGDSICYFCGWHVFAMRALTRATLGSSRANMEFCKASR